MKYILLLLAICFCPLYAAPIVFQPEFKWKDGSTSQLGTGSFIRAPNGKIIGLTSAHFIDFSGPLLLEVEWLDIKTNKAIASSRKSWGMPGRQGSHEPLDLRSDYLLLLMEKEVSSQSILEMDQRTDLPIGERIWFPNKNATAKEGYDLIEGKTHKTGAAYITIKLDKKIDLQSRSGTPVISQSTGKVIGILTSCDNTDTTLLYLAPGLSIYKGLLKAKQPLFLQDVVGQ